MNGRKFELQTADMGTSVEKAITEGRRMISTTISICHGRSHAGAALALAKFIAGRDDVLFWAGWQTASTIQRSWRPLIGRANLSTVEMGRILAEHLKKMPKSSA